MISQTTAKQEEKVIQVLQAIYDPEIPISIYDLGLIYKIDIKDSDVNILMTLTTPHCPFAQSLPETIRTKLKEIPGLKNIHVKITFDPPWNKDMLSAKAKKILNLS